MNNDTPMNPSTCVLPFEMFRVCAPTLSHDEKNSTWIPPCDIYETSAEIVIKMELPELKKQDLRVELETNALILRGERKFEEVTDRENYHRIERHYGQFMRSFKVPAVVDATKVNAKFKEGVLTVTLKKCDEAKQKHIVVKVN